jgi:NTE family protein
MYERPSNLVFEGGGVLGIAYLGVLQYLTQNDILMNLKRVAGTSAGAITACITSFNLPFTETKKIADTLDFRKVPGKDPFPDLLKLSKPAWNELEKIFGDLDCVYRLLNNYGWFSTEYFYHWIKKQIESQFDPFKKLPPYTFADFKNPYIHKENRPFFDLYVIGTDLSYRSSRIFSCETTPDMEVAEAVRISMSIPLFFEAIELDEDYFIKDGAPNIYCDGGVMWNYPINIFDSITFEDRNAPALYNQTLGARFLSRTKYHEINNLLDYIKNLYHSQMRIQQDIFDNSPEDQARSIQIDPGDVSAIDFDISIGDETYKFLYSQGYQAARSFFEK